MWYVYILKCRTDVLYTGVTGDLNRRLQEHTNYKSGKFTNYNKPDDIVYYEKFENKIKAENREKQIKKWSKAKKIALINSDFNRLKELSKSRD